MMAELARRGAMLAAARQRLRVGRIAGELRKLFGDSAVETDEARVLIRGKGLVKRWLIDPDLRFLKQGMR